MGTSWSYDRATHPRLAGAFAHRGLTEREIAAAMGVNPSSITRWKRQHPDFCAALKEGKEHADALVEGALFSRAIGKTTEETKVVEGKKAKRVTTHKLAPDVTACIFWLKNRKRKRWADRSTTRFVGTGEDGAIKTETKSTVEVVLAARVQKFDFNALREAMIKSAQAETAGGGDAGRN